MSPSDRLVAHLRSWLGEWPPSPDRPVTITSSPLRSLPGWDGRVRPVAGVATTEHAVLSVPKEHHRAVAELGTTLDEIGPGLPDAVGRPDWRFNSGVGRKLHDRYGHELAVVTEEDHRGRGWATRLVSQAAEYVLADGAVPTYLHGPGNEASARTADACGFPDRGWRILGLFPSVPG